MTKRSNRLRPLLAAALSAGAILLASCATTGGAGGSQERTVRAGERVDLGERLVVQGRLDDALAQFAMAIEENPTLTTAYLGMSDVYRMQGDYQAAEQNARRAAEIEPRNFRAQYSHGLALQMLRRLTEAVRAYLRALAIEPNDFEANLNLATAYLQLEEPLQALPYARRAAQINADDGPVRVNLGAILAALDRHDEAVVAYQAAAERMDLTPPLLLNLADSLGKTERYVEMVNTLDQLIEIEPSAQAYERLGFARFRMGQYDLALEAFNYAVQLDANHFPALNGVGVCLLNRYVLSDQSDLDARERAIDALRRSVRINRNQPRIIDLISRYG